MTNEEIKRDEHLITALKLLIRSAMLYSDQAHKAVFNEKEGELAGAIYLQRASAKMAAAEAVYYSNYEILARDEAEDVFRQFDEFADELTEDFATNHSQQWTDIEYDRLKETFDNTVFAFEE